MTYVRPLIGLVSAALVAGGLSLPAQATNTQGMSVSQPRPQSSPPRAERQADQRRICVRAHFTETRIPRTICKTAAQWEAEGGIPTNDE